MTSWRRDGRHLLDVVNRIGVRPLAKIEREQGRWYMHLLVGDIWRKHRPGYKTKARATAAVVQLTLEHKLAGFWSEQRDVESKREFEAATCALEASADLGASVLTIEELERLFDGVELYE